MIRWGALVLAACSSGVLAQSAYFDARAAGQVGERYDGYLGYALTQPSAQARQQTEAINIRRRALYSDLAQRKGVSREEIGITAGCTLLGRVEVGERYLLGDGQWRVRRTGERAPIPDYCGG